MYRYKIPSPIGAKTTASGKTLSIESLCYIIIFAFRLFVDSDFAGASRSNRTLETIVVNRFHRLYPICCTRPETKICTLGAPTVHFRDQHFDLAPPPSTVYHSWSSENRWFCSTWFYCGVLPEPTQPLSKPGSRAITTPRSGAAFRKFYTQRGPDLT